MIEQTVRRLTRLYCDSDNKWLTVPVTVAALFVLLVLVKSCQGMVYYHSDECKIYRLGYPIEQARALTAALPQQQARTFIANNEHDSIAYPLLSRRYFIANNFNRYLAYHKMDTTGTALDIIIALVNTGRDLDRETSAVPCDTTRGPLMLVNGRHYLDESYKPAHLVTFSKNYSYEEQKAQRVVVDAFMAMQQACKEHTDAQLMVNSAYRSYHDQQGTYNRSEKGYAARPGSSEHQTGYAIDVTSRQHPMRWPFDKSVECAWMHEHCHEYGFILRYPKRQSQTFGFAYEPWHLRYVGKEAARLIHDEDITFDEYYAYFIDAHDPHAEPQKR